MPASQLSTWLSRWSLQRLLPHPQQMRWSRLSITHKFTVAFGLFALLIGFMALTGYVALRGVRRQSEEVLASSMQAQALVLEMRVLLEQARRYERDFILRYPQEGLDVAVATYADAVNANLDQLEAMSRDLNRQLLQLDGVLESNRNTMPTMRDIATLTETPSTTETPSADTSAPETGVSPNSTFTDTTIDTTTNTTTNTTNNTATETNQTDITTDITAADITAADITATVVAYLSVADSYRQTFNEAVALVEQLAAPRGGVQQTFEQQLTVLRFRLELTNNANLTALYYELLAAAKEYLLTRQTGDMRAVLRLTDSITRNLELMLGIDDTTRQQALDAVAEVVASADRLLVLDQTIRTTLAGFDMQASSLDSVAANLVDFVTARANQARSAIASATRSATIALFVAVVAASLLTVLVAMLVKTTITDKVIALGQTAQALRQGDLAARAPVSSGDELGVLADSINDMASQLSLLVTDLEAQVQARTAKLNDANERIHQLNARLQDENMRMERELDVTRKLQQMVLPSEGELAAIPLLDIATYMAPADEVGGDYYDALMVTQDGKTHLNLAIGDVAGHGLESGVVMIMAQAIVRALHSSGKFSLADILQILNVTLYDNLARMQVDRSLTLALLTCSGNQLQICGQHESLLIVRASGEVETHSTLDLGLPLALEPDIRQHLNHAHFELAPGDGIVLYTDGITEAENNHRQQYGLTRLSSVISQHWHTGAHAVKDAIIHDVRDYIGEQKVFDDITLVVAQKTAHKHAPTV